MDRDETIALLEANHEFPGAYPFRVVVRRDAAAAVVSAMVAAAGEGASVLSLDERNSKNGTYKALHMSMQVQSPEQVLDVYDVLKRLDAVMTAL
jgi:putative lipoic acid-binding regulatory protein